MVDVAGGRPVWALGLMSGTSMDGVDVALVRTDGETIAGFGPTGFSGMPPPLRDALLRALPRIAALSTVDLRSQAAWPAWLRDLDASVAHWLEDALAGVALRNGPGSGRASGPWTDLDGQRGGAVLGVHGQTVLHRPAEAFTLQLGISRPLRAGSLPATVVSDFRSADMAAGGEGAPLVPFFHHACARWAGLTEPVAFLNIGGVANVTWLDPAIEDPVEACLAFDTGPGNALIDDWMARHGGAPMDRDGAAAAAGRVHRDRLGSNAARAYLDRRPPKSLDRNAFAGVLAAMEGLAVADGAATLTAFTVDCIAQALRHMPVPPARWLVCGGGRRNATTMAGLSARLPGVEPVEAIGLDGDMLEAQAFAYLAVRVLRGLATSAPGTTGCRQPVCGGRIAWP